MPNLSYDPTDPRDLLDQPIAEGDIVAWGTTYGRSAGLCVARIEKIRFVDRVSGAYGSRKEVPQHEAKAYTLRLVPIKSTGAVTDVEFVYDPQNPGNSYHRPVTPKPKTVQLVKNVVKLEGAALAEAQRIETDHELAVQAAMQKYGA